MTDGEDIPYDHSVMPHCVEPMDEADNSAVEAIVLWMARRMGKTEGICGNIVGRTVTDDPGNIYSMWPVEDSSDRFSRDVIEPMIEATPALQKVFVERKSRDSGRTIDYKRFHGGSLYLVNSGSKSKSRGMAAKVVMLHEPDAYPVSSGGEGDPISKALGRADGFEEAIKVIEGTGTFTPLLDEKGRKVYRSNIELWYDRGDQRKWFCHCRKCAQDQWLKYEQIRPVKGGDCHYFCEYCEAPHNEAQWRRMVSNGRWKPTAPFLRIRSYWINQFNSLLPTGRGYKSKLHQLYEEGRRAINGKPEEKQVWIQEVKCELWNPDEEKSPPPPYQPILDGRESYAPESGEAVIPSRGLVLTTMTDLHGDRLEVEWRAWSREEESWGMGHYVLFGDTNRTEVWDEWTRHLQRPWKHESGGMLRMALGLVDGGWRLDPIVATFRRLKAVNVPGVSGKLIASKGVPKWRQVIHNQWGTIGQKGGVSFKGIHIGTWGAKSLCYERLRWHSAAIKPEAGFMHFGKRYSDEFIRQVVSESSEFKIIDGVNVETFKNPEGNRNEALDLLVGNLAAFRRRRWDFETIEAGLTEQVRQAKTGIADNTPKPKLPERKSPFGGRGWKL